MKAKKIIPTLFGFTQEKITMLLRIRRSQWALYELGLKPVPLVALQKLRQILLVINAADKTIEKTETDGQKEKHLLVIKKLLDENDFQQQVLLKKIADFEKKIQ